ncbi:16S rRNA (uracil(1498)-N(3))-methyltransferase [Rubrimonas cliftonensis]|uniref:Ribosomal RNA small subunit methyltransferase E n=1 Tax=Rubrimonas cliftonensis TaxID=89524 RepID=A0A1H4DH21_9RHOB|nr:16S rRNA (uracil(1498)-N(3))-methyltransferase [Rubrimonas cliftonensis]SEA72034.1 16S rRNA (uracil1498-N3)-methyltransferase [Rubrimonas cliftonensis]
MQQDAPKVRLFVDAPLGDGAAVALERAQAHYLFTVMRLGQGDAVALFNGRDGEWRAVATEAGRKGGALRCAALLRPQAEGPDLDLIFAPIKKARTDFIAEKACEMGARRLIPCLTRFTNAERVNVERLRAHAVEAAEQCEILSVPQVLAPAPLAALLDAWEAGRRLMVCDEARDAPPAMDALRAAGREAGSGPGPWAVLIGPEGGFAPEERARLSEAPFVTRVSLGPRVLRADTAAVAALALWQAALGDWRA